jgi:hypothetical protein
LAKGSRLANGVVTGAHQCLGDDVAERESLAR